MKAVAKKEVSEILDVDAALPCQENERAAKPQCPSTPSQAHYLCQLNTLTILFKLLSKLVISEIAQIFPTLSEGCFSVVQSNSLDCEETLLSSKALGASEKPPDM